MVKGVSKRVIVVRSPDPKLFEQAIFIVREDALRGGVTADRVVEEAKRVAGRYVRRNTRWGRRFSALPPAAWAAAGALVTTALWSLAPMLGF